MFFDTKCAVYYGKSGFHLFFLIMGSILDCVPNRIAATFDKLLVVFPCILLDWFQYLQDC